MEPRWPKNRCKNASFFWCLLESIFGWILVDFGYQNRAKLAPEWDQKSMLTPKGVFSKNSIFPKEKLGFFGSKASKSRAKTDQKSIKKWSPRWNASWHRFFSDFGRFWVPSWGGKSIKNRSKMASKKRLKKEGQQDGRQDAPRAYGSAGPDRPEARERG